MKPFQPIDGLGHRLVEVGELVVDVDRRDLLGVALPAAVADAASRCRRRRRSVAFAGPGKAQVAVVPLGEEDVRLAAGRHHRDVLGADVEGLDVEREADAERVVEVEVELPGSSRRACPPGPASSR